MRDFTGREIQVGDIILYSKTFLQSSVLNIGVVKKIIGGQEHKISAKTFDYWMLDRGRYNSDRPPIPANSTFSKCETKCFILDPIQVPEHFRDFIEKTRREIYESTNDN